MDKIIIRGGRRLAGEVQVSGSKNAALPILISSLLTGEPCLYHGIPDLKDIDTTLKLLAGLGVNTEKNAAGEIRIEAEDVADVEAPYDLVKT
ncbi:MAG: UDP-N-acetylglucosamine 1-carboxyvinyltransferase, partial [Candidatus Binatia bacterium]